MNSVNVAGKRIHNKSSPKRAIKIVLVGLFIFVFAAGAIGIFFLTKSNKLKLTTQVHTQPALTTLLKDSDGGKSEEANSTEKQMALHFWDYSLVLSPSLIKNLELELPYAKGPPERLLGSIIFRDVTTHEAVLELQGKRPRTLNPQIIARFFPVEGSAEKTKFLLWRDPEARELLEALSKETNLSVLNEELNLIKVFPALQAEGASEPFLMVGQILDPSKRISFIYIKGDGSFFQVGCRHGCPFTEILKNAIFAGDPKINLNQRKSFALSQVQAALAGAAKNQNEATPFLPWYLASYLTLDPRDPEAYFHLGKITTNAVTQASSIQYAKDVGLEEIKLFELKSSGTAAESKKDE